MAKSLQGHITPEMLSAMFMGFSMAFNQKYNETESLIEKVAMISESTSSKQGYPFLGQTGHFREWVGERVFQQLKAHGFAIENKTFEQSHAISRDVIEDDEYGVFKTLFEDLGLDAKLFPDEILFGLMRDAHNTVCYDGQNFYDHEHPINTKHDLTGSNVPTSNILTQSQSSDKVWHLLCTTRSVMPYIWQWRKRPVFGSVTEDTQGSVWTSNKVEYGTHLRGNAGVGMWQLAIRVEGDITFENFRKARAMMAAFQGDGAKRLSLEGNRIVCAKSDEDDFLDMFENEFINGSTNPAHKYRNKVDVVASPFLDPDIAPKIIVP